MDLSKNLSSKTRVVGIGVAAAAALAAAGVATAGSAHAASLSTWERVAACESGGNWSINTGNGFYGGLQFTHSTWIAYGGGAYASNANLASESAQITIAEKVLASQGPGAWPVCSVRAGLTQGGGSPVTAPPASSAPKQSAPQSSAQQQSSSAPQTSRSSARPTYTAPKVSSVPQVAISGKTVTVKAGDTLSQLAEKLHIKGGWQELYAANKGTVNNPNLIFVGQHLHLPA
ncbi:transglycosylase family protein [Flexivirga caeni]|uniref:LysM peptidoglycan-binding domain-containing protein n=1 Tax=Flexivirga caeni TaxID=2294115 RepID=A0A3M9MA26_9MICO|nr:transglycosylase family protein [Flexivirga caeni]RNI21398.1 LysM peptidoglycan-binding domain-containing protein [Flexivirga caeni]